MNKPMGWEKYGDNVCGRCPKYGKDAKDNCKGCDPFTKHEYLIEAQREIKMFKRKKANLAIN